MRTAAAFGFVSLLVGCNGVSAVAILDDASVEDATTVRDATLGADAATTPDPDDASAIGDASDAAPPKDAGDGGALSDAEAGTKDAACPVTEIVPDAGDTCAGFGTGSSCDTTCGIPPYGYVCSNGGPPGFPGCKRVSNSAILGGTYCCPDLKCVRVQSQDNHCSDAGLAPLLYQCATTSDGGLLATPSAAQTCTEVSGLPVYRYFCCQN